MRDRIKRIMDSEQLTPSAFADRLEIGRAVMSHLLNGRNKPSLDVVTRILAEMTNINSDWLLTGEGEMHKKDLPPNGIETELSLEINDTQFPIIQPDNDLFSQTENRQAPRFNPPVQQIPPSPIIPQQGSHQSQTAINANQLKETSEYRKQNLVEKTADAKKVTKIIIYYNDNTFETFEADNKPL